MANHLNTIFPMAAIIEKLFGKTKDQLRDELDKIGSERIVAPASFVLEKQEEISSDLELENATIKNAIPGAIKIPLQYMLDAGFTIDFYLKDDTENCIDDKNGSGIIIMNVQHENPKASSLIDGYSINFDPISEIEIATLNSVILDYQIPGVFGKKYDINEAMKHSSIRIRDIILEREETRKLMLAKLEEYNKNPEKREKDTKKAFENLKFKWSTLKNKADADKSQEFTQGALKILGGIAGINNLKSFDELKNIPIFKKEIDAGGSFAELLDKFCSMASSMAPQLEANINTEATEVEQVK